jgi:biopolymer transport protein ExbD
MINKLIAFRTVAVCVFLAAPHFGQAQEYLSGMKWNEPPVVTPGKTSADPPSDAVILFDGKDLSAWENGENWTVKDGVATIGKGEIKTKQSFGDCQLHIEWSAPNPPKGHSQGRGNSGVFMQDRYEVQVLDSYNDKTYFDGQASAIYKQRPPMVNAMRPPGEWNTYEIIWDAPKFKDDGSLEAPAYVTVIHNGVLTQNHFALEGITDFPQVPHYVKHGRAPIHLQDHGNPVRYRNIWVREIKPIEGTREREPYFHDHKTGKDTPIPHNLKVDVPDASSVEGESGLPLVFELKRNDAGKTAMYLNGNPTDEIAVRKLFRVNAVKKDQSVSISADRGIAYGQVIKVVHLLESLGLKKIALNTRSAEPLK